MVMGGGNICNFGIGTGMFEFTIMNQNHIVVDGYISQKMSSTPSFIFILPRMLHNADWISALHLFLKRQDA